MATTYFNQQIQAVDGILFRLRCYRDPQRIRNDVLDILKNIPSLQPRSGTLPSARASTTQILYLAGTVPIYYSGNQYNIPVSIYLIEAYPFSPPVPYVTPTPDMIIKPKHRHVDSAGMVYLPYLSGWNPNTSNLVGLSQVLIKVFTEDPPVRAAPKVTSPTPSPANQYPTGTTNTYPGSSTSGYPGSSSGGYPPYPSSSTGTPYPSGTTTPGAYPYPTGNQSPYGQPPALPPKSGYGTPTQPYENPADVAKRNVIRSVTEKLQAAFNEFNSKTTKEIDDLMAVTSAEEDKARRLDKEKNDLSSNKVQIDSDIEDLSKKFEDLTQWLEHNDSTTKPLDIDTITEPRDPISKQLLTLVAEDATIEDTLYYLEKSLGNENMNTDAFLKAYRNLATEQFMKRATIKKIHEKQRGL